MLHRIKSRSVQTMKLIETEFVPLKFPKLVLVEVTDFSVYSGQAIEAL